MKKKLIIAGSVLLGLIIVILTLCFTVFTVKTIEVDFRTSTTNNYEEQQIIEESQFKYGKCLLFLGKKKATTNIEKKYPYLEVINIETVFPSKLIIHCAERQGLYAIKNQQETLICDKDFKVLEIFQSDVVSTKENEIALSGLNFENKEVEKGDFLTIDQIGMKNFLSSMLENSLTYNQTIGFCKEISLESEKNDLTGKEEDHLTITTFTGRKITILNIDSGLNFKIQKMLQALPKLYELLVTNGDYTSEEVDRCSLVIGNQITDETELYVHVYLDGEIVSSPNK